VGWITGNDVIKLLLDETTAGEEEARITELLCVYDEGRTLEEEGEDRILKLLVTDWTDETETGSMPELP
jgi:hypothetical protein